MISLEIIIRFGIVVVYELLRSIRFELQIILAFTRLGYIEHLS